MATTALSYGHGSVLLAVTTTWSWFFTIIETRVEKDQQCDKSLLILNTQTRIINITRPLTKPIRLPGTTNPPEFSRAAPDLGLGHVTPITGPKHFQARIQPPVWQPHITARLPSKLLHSTNNVSITSYSHTLIGIKECFTILINALIVINSASSSSFGSILEVIA